MNQILFLANNNIGPGLSGGDRIFIELIRYWQKDINITLMGSPESLNLLKRYNLEKVPVILTDNEESRLPLFFHTIKRSLFGVIAVLKNLKFISGFDYVYSVSDFLPDLLPSLLIKILNPRIKWIAGYYLFAPPPFSKTSPYIQTGQFFKGLIYFIIQTFTRPLVNLFADLVFVTSVPDTKFFRPRSVVIRGGVDTTISNKYLSSHANIKIDRRQYEAVFQGRLHPQKGVLELIDIWRLVCLESPKAKLVIIGDGPLENEVWQKIKTFHLEKNITLTGFLDNNKKYRIFRQSKIVVHPAVYDSGGMAAAEAMAWGLPGVSFDLEALKTYYPKGMIKTPCFDFAQFADNIKRLLSDKSLYLQTSHKARELIKEEWDWQKRARDIFKETFTL